MVFNTIVALGAIALQLGIICILVGWAIKAPFVRYIASHTGIILASIFTIATLLSLIYQYGLGYEPCILCWYQRILIIPIALIAWTANMRTSKLLQTQVLTLASIGIAIALFHVGIEQFPGGIDVCGANGISCTVRYVYEFGYITIPVMSLTTLATGFVLALLAKKYPKA